MHTARIRNKKTGVWQDIEVTTQPDEAAVRGHLEKVFPGSEVLEVLPQEKAKPPEATDKLAPPSQKPPEGDKPAQEIPTGKPADYKNAKPEGEAT